MYIFITALILIACGLLILVVLVQNSKGGGLASNFQSTGQTMGVRNTADFLEKATWVLASVVIALSILSAGAIKMGNTENGSIIQDKIENAVDLSAPMSFPAGTTPAETTPEEEPAE